MPSCLAKFCTATDRGLTYLAGRVAVQNQLARYRSVYRRTQSTVSAHHSAQTTSSVSEDDYLDFILDNAGSDKSKSLQYGFLNASVSAAIPPKITTPVDSREEEARTPGQSRLSDQRSQPTNAVPQKVTLSLHTTVQVEQRDTFTERLRRLRRARRRTMFKDGLLGPPLPAKSLQLRSLSRPSDVYHSAWNVNFARLAARYDTHYARHFLEPISPYLDIRTPQIVDKVLERANGEIGSIPITALTEITEGRKPAVVWAEVALWLLVNDPSRAIDFLLATHAGPMYPPLTWVEDSLEYLARHFKYSNMEDKQQHMSKLRSAFITLSKRAANGEHMAIRGSAIYHMMRYCSHEEIGALYSTIRSNEVVLHPQIYTRFATRFARQGDLEQGLDALLQAHARGDPLRSYSFLSTCSTLLRASIEQPDGMRMCLRLVDKLVGIGVKLNTQLTNIIMLNAANSGEGDTATSIYSSMTTNGVEPDAYTFAILLKVCKMDIDNAAALRDIIQLAVERGDVRRNVVLSNEILHCLALHHSKHNRHTAFSTVSDAYVGLFDPEPLEALGIKMPERTGVSTHDDSTPPPLPPSTQTLNILLSVYLRHCSVHEARRLYLQWREMIDQGDERMRALASTSHLYNAFMKAFTTTKESLFLAGEVFEYMEQQAGTGQGANETDKQPNPSAAPDVYSWSILLHGFLKHGYDKGARQLQEGMREQGIEATDVTWNTIISGYARQQMLNRVLEGIEGMWAADRAFDQWTYRGLARLSDRNKIRLRAKLAEMEYVKRLDFTPELKHDLSDKLQQMTLYQPMHDSAMSDKVVEAETFSEREDTASL